MLRLRPFSYFAPSTLREAVEIFGEKGDEACPLAGGTDLLVRMKRGEIGPKALVNLKCIEGLDEIKIESEKGIQIGALASLSEVERSPLVHSNCPVLAQAAGVVGSPSIRNLGTLGGNISRGSPAADTIPALLLLKAKAAVVSLQGEREVDLKDFFLGPGQTILSPREVMTSIFVPKPAPHTGAVYLKLGRREGMDVALVGVAAMLSLSGQDGEAREARIALSAVSPVPLLVKRAEEVLLSGPLTDERFEKAARVAAEESSPISDMRGSAHYRREMVRVLAFRALVQAFQLAQGGKIEV